MLIDGTLQAFYPIHVYAQSYKLDGQVVEWPYLNEVNKIGYRHLPGSRIQPLPEPQPTMFAEDMQRCETY